MGIVMHHTAALSTARASVSETVRSSPSEPGQSQDWDLCEGVQLIELIVTVHLLPVPQHPQSDAALKLLGKIGFYPRVFNVWGRQIPLRISESHFFTV